MPEKVRRPDFCIADLWLVVSVAMSDDSKPSDRVSAWVSDGAEGTGDALVVVETDAVTTGKIGLSEAICIQCSLLAAGDSGLRSFVVIMEAFWLWWM